MTGGLPVVLLHGWPVTDLHWHHLAPRLRAAGFNPLPITLPGFGSGADGGTDFRKSALAARVSARLAAAGIARCAVVGHDWGGTVAVHLAAAAPGTVSALVVEEEVLPGIDVAVPSPALARRLTPRIIQPISCAPECRGTSCAARRTAAAPAGTGAMGDSLTVERWTLTPLVLVRIQVPQPPPSKIS